MTFSLLANASKQAAAATPTTVAAMADVEGAKLGAAAERKRRQESADSLTAALESRAKGGKGVRWERRVNVSGETRTVGVWEREGAYSERAFLAECRRAARAAGKGRLRWDGDAIESIAAELCVSILSRTAGRMPIRGSLGRREGFEQADAAYLTASASRLIADALNGDRRRAGLSAEIDALAAADGAPTVSTADLLARSASAAEGEPDRYLAEMALTGMRRVRNWAAADWATAEAIAAEAAKPFLPETARRIRIVADAIGERPAALQAAIAAALRHRSQLTGGYDQAADLAAAGYAASSGAFRKNVSVGRGILRRLWEMVPQDREQAAALQHLATLLDGLCEIETPEPVRPHMGETNGPTLQHGGGRLDWPGRTAQSGSEWKRITSEELSRYP